MRRQCIDETTIRYERGGLQRAETHQLSEVLLCAAIRRHRAYECSMAKASTARWRGVV